jgi:NADPH:quinone reductase
MTGGAPIVAALDSVGGEESGQLLHLLGEGGQLTTFGAMANQPMIVDPGDLIFKRKGFWAAKLGSGARRAEIPRAIGEIVRLAATGELKLTVEKAYPLEEAAEAARASMQPGRTGKIAFRA